MRGGQVGGVVQAQVGAWPATYRLLSVLLGSDVRAEKRGLGWCRDHHAAGYKEGSHGLTAVDRDIVLRPVHAVGRALESGAPRAHGHA